MLQEHVPLHTYANYKIGGPARYFWRATTVKEIKEGLLLAKKLKAKVFILGGGTNLLIPDEGYSGFVVKPDLMMLTRRGNTVTAGAGILMFDLLNFTAKEKLSGLEWAGGLPGTLGGAIRGNAGAFGGEIKDTIVSVKSIDIKTGKVITRSRRACRFGYRASVFKEKKGREVIVEASFRLTPGDAKAIKKAIKAKIKYRLERHPMEYPNIGSMFKNVAVKDVPKSRYNELVYDVKTDPIPVIPTARLLIKANLRGKKIGGAMISLKHPNFIVNVNKASAKHVVALLELAKKTVKKKFSITLVEEVERL
jgi:UDP-N-acetylmuramate dehydrogenase